MKLLTLFFSLAFVGLASAADEAQIKIALNYSLNGAVIKYDQQYSLNITNPAASQPIQTISTNWTAIPFGDVPSNACVVVHNLSTNTILRLAVAGTNVFSEIPAGQHQLTFLIGNTLLGQAATNTVQAQSVIIPRQ